MSAPAVVPVPAATFAKLRRLSRLGAAYWLDKDPAASCEWSDLADELDVACGELDAEHWDDGHGDDGR